MGHRLRIAGAKGEIFDGKALELLYARSGGIPRRINQICDIALLTAMARKSPKATEEILKESIETLER